MRQTDAAARAPVIDALRPAGVAVVETTVRVSAETLLPAERVSLGSAAEGRLLEFAAGRSCARRALAALGLPEAPIRRGSDRQPLWPPGVVGSITHCRDYAAAAVGHRARFAALGIDAEPHERLPEGVLDQIALDDEAAWLAGRADDVCWDRLLFCAKEAVFKAWYPLTERWLGFKDATVHFDPKRWSFRAELVGAAAQEGRPLVTRFEGRFGVGDLLVATLVAVDAAVAGKQLGCSHRNGLDEREHPRRDDGRHLEAGRREQSA